MIKLDLSSQVIAEAESTNQGIPYGDAFTVLSRFVIDKISDNRTKLVICSLVNWKYKPNFIMKAFIDKNANTGMVDNFKALSKLNPYRWHYFDSIHVHCGVLFFKSQKSKRRNREKRQSTIIIIIINDGHQWSWSWSGSTCSITYG
jgi:hypothetical protein